MCYVLVLWNFLVPLNKLAAVGLVLKILYKNVPNAVILCGHSDIVGNEI
jgi:hypothetical protein